MSDEQRELPEQPSLRFLKLEAKRRLATGEFATLHDAQLAVAREHGLSSWAVLKETVTAEQAEPNPALGHVRWLVDRFRDAGGAAWVPPTADDLGEHFTAEFLTHVPPDAIAGVLIKAAPAFRQGLTVEDSTDLAVRAQVGGMRLEAAAEAAPPHRLAMARIAKLSQLISDDRVTAPPTATAGRVPAGALATAGESFAELGLPGLIMTGADPVAGDTAAGDTTEAGAWSLARGWANLERPEPLDRRHQFPVHAITQVVTSTVALRLVAEGRVDLDAPANEYLRTVRLADGEVTVRELLSHTGGVANPPQDPFGDASTDVLSWAGPVMACPGPRGTFHYSIGGYAVAGQLIADVTGGRFEDAAESLVLRPLGLTGSSFPAGWPEHDAVTGYQVDDAGRFAPAPARICVIPAMGGLWSTAADLARFGAAWGSLLPADLAAEALRPQAPVGTSGAGMGLGWPVRLGDDPVAGLAGGGPGAGSSLLIALDTGRVRVTMANRFMVLQEVNLRLLRATA